MSLETEAWWDDLQGASGFAHPSSRMLASSIYCLHFVTSAISPFLSVLPIWAGPVAWGLSRLVFSQAGLERRAEELGHLLPSLALLQQRALLNLRMAGSPGSLAPRTVWGKILVHRSTFNHWDTPSRLQEIFLREKSIVQKLYIQCYLLLCKERRGNKDMHIYLLTFVTRNRKTRKWNWGMRV